MGYKIIKYKDGYRVIEEYLHRNIFTKLGISKPKLKQRKVYIKTLSPNKGGNFNNGHTSIWNYECKGDYSECERFLEVLNLKPVYLKSDSFWKNVDTYYPCLVFSRNGGFYSSYPMNNFWESKINIYYSNFKRPRTGSNIIGRDYHDRYYSIVYCYLYEEDRDMEYKIKNHKYISV